MRQMMPEVKKIREKGGYSRNFYSLFLFGEVPFLEEAKEILHLKLWNYEELGGSKDGIGIHLRSLGEIQELLGEQTWLAKAVPEEEAGLFQKQGYLLDISEEEIQIFTDTKEGLVYALATVKQLLEEGEGFCLPCITAADWPSIKYRSLSVTFAWYAGYGRFGFDMQLWGLEEWKQFLNICSDYKMNQLNMCLYGYWPFHMKEYPEAELRGLKMKLWNPESENWVEVEYMHPNLAEEFLPQLIEYGHKLGIQFFAYIGLNSYSGGYSNAHPDQRMKMPKDSHFINDFDSLCLSDEKTIQYLKQSMRNIVAQGFDGIDFEESEEAFWYCNCKTCRQTFWKGCKTPEETLHAANTWLLKILYEELKAARPDITIGIRAWREPPLVRSEELREEMKASIPEDVVLFWAPGQYVEESEFEKWVRAFGRDRIRARDTEAIGFAAGLGRLIRPFKWNGLRCEEEPITQYIDEDIRQHRGSVKMHAAGINGYLFEWYGFFMAFFAHAYYSWGGEKAAEDFYRYSLQAVFGGLADDIYFVMTQMFTIHESQLNIFELEFPFAKNKVEERDIPRIQEAIEVYPVLIQKLDGIIETLRLDKRNSAFALHFKKWKVSVMRSRVIYDMALESLKYEKAETEEERQNCLRKMYLQNEREFEIIRENYFDVNPVTETGTASCMIPYHELKRCILNRLYPDRRQEKPVYLGVESLGWMWF
nr:glycoside hydrolase family 20 zincin-like fold domain-containing protein [uncultured Faecalicatena sp.]